MTGEHAQLPESYVQARAAADALRGAWAAFLPAAPRGSSDWKPLPTPNIAAVFEALVAAENVEQRAQQALFEFLRPADR